MKHAMVKQWGYVREFFTWLTNTKVGRRVGGGHCIKRDVRRGSGRGITHVSQSGTWVGGGLTGGHFKMLNWIEFTVKSLCQTSSTRKGLVTSTCKSCLTGSLNTWWEVRSKYLTAPAVVLRTTFHNSNFFPADMKTDKEFG